MSDLNVLFKQIEAILDDELALDLDEWKSGVVNSLIQTSIRIWLTGYDMDIEQHIPDDMVLVPREPTEEGEVVIGVRDLQKAFELGAEYAIAENMGEACFKLSEFEQLKQRDQWIPVSERLPIDEEFERVVDQRLADAYEEAQLTKGRQIEKSADNLAWDLIVDLIRNKFTSGNDVPVDRIALKRSEVEAILQPPTAEDK